MPWWNFVDWSWPGGTPPGTSGAGTSILSLQYALALRDAAAMEDAIGMANEAKLHRALADEIVSAAGKTCWDEKKGLLADSPDKKSFSQHGTVLGVLEGAIPQAQWKRAMKTAIADNSIAQCTLYFRYFLNRAADKAGLGDEYLSLLKPWRDMLALGLTTWPETPIEPRSECHGWSASPTVDLLSIVCGVKPDKGGFSRVVVEPHPGGLDWVKCEVPNPKGMIRVSLKKNQNGYSADVELPDGVPGVFVWKGKETPLKPGKQSPLK
jgi:hypothetical protein